MVALVWTLCAMAGLYVIGRELFDRNTGLIAAFFYSVFQPWWTWKNLSFDGEMLMNLPIIWAWAIALAPQFVATATRTLSSGRASRRSLPTQTAGRDSSSPARHLSTSPELPG